MSTSTVKQSLVSIAASISTELQALKAAKQRISTAVSNLNSIPNIHADTISEIDEYAPNGEFESLCKDEKELLTAEFISLRGAANAAVSALSSITEF